jgi:hypothetical protein
MTTPLEAYVPSPGGVAHRATGSRARVGPAFIRLVSVRSCSRSGIASPAVKRPKAASIDASRGWHTASPILRSDRYSRTETHIARLPRRVAAMSPG